MNFCWAEGTGISSGSVCIASHQECLNQPSQHFGEQLNALTLVEIRTLSSQWWFSAWKKKWGVGKFWIAACRVEVNDHSTRAIFHCAVIIYWKVGGCKQQLSRETNQLKKIMSYRFPDTDPGKIINYKINVIHGTWDLILSMLGFERFWLCWNIWMLQESSSCLYKRWFYKLKQS